MTEENQESNLGRGRGFGRNSGRKQGGGGRRFRGVNAGGYCVCPSCGYKEEHQAGVPCFEKKCPQCKTDLVRE